jgi:DNA mismatch endonuclease (patch repair protein)
MGLILTAPTDRVRAQMTRQRVRGTSAEIALRRELHRRGRRFRIHKRPVPMMRREADILFARAKVAVFVDGCFWHGCPVHGTMPKSNGEFWRDKLDRNRSRDAETNDALQSLGWTVVRVWEHESPVEAADRVGRAVQARTARVRSRA